MTKRTGDKSNFFNTHAYATAELLVDVLKRCSDDLSRDNVLKQMTHLKDVRPDMLLPGIVINTDLQDYRGNRKLKLVLFDCERWRNVGQPIQDDILSDCPAKTQGSLARPYSRHRSPRGSDRADMRGRRLTLM